MLGVSCLDVVRVRSVVRVVLDLVWAGAVAVAVVGVLMVLSLLLH